ncbi:MAG TPA: hypothetical protein VM432_00460, partial [Bdellovibrionales bacterium]|nr:hypothetical protein [Bdellovibrionales bacterium]
MDTLSALIMLCFFTILFIGVLAVIHQPLQLTRAWLNAVFVLMFFAMMLWSQTAGAPRMIGLSWAPLILAGFA